MPQSTPMSTCDMPPSRRGERVGRQPANRVGTQTWARVGRAALVLHLLSACAGRRSHEPFTSPVPADELGKLIEPVLAAVKWQEVCRPSPCESVVVRTHLLLAFEFGYQSSPRVMLHEIVVGELPHADSLPRFSLGETSPQPPGVATVELAVYSSHVRGPHPRATAYFTSDTHPMGLSAMFFLERKDRGWRVRESGYVPY